MLFNSYEFIFFFLPVTLIVFLQIRQRIGGKPALVWLVFASLFFYAWWYPPNIVLLAVSILFNYGMGGLINRYVNWRKLCLALGVAGNLLLLGYFKYANFFVENLNFLSGSAFHVGKIVLPLAISFFTFQQIAFLVDMYRGELSGYSFLDYCLFVTFFPQLIAGPIVHHQEVIPQFQSGKFLQFNFDDLVIGLTIFFIGLFKKVIIADAVAVYASSVFDAAQAGHSLTLFEAWVGALAYTFQIYFDFSGYSDMAIGLARMFGVLLPLNFHSPYKATNIIEFWRRWHITLSSFLRNYLYIPLGGNRKGSHRRYANLMITMLLGGLWHGAGWTFVIWGGLHGIYLVINHAWRSFSGVKLFTDSPAGVILGRSLTFGSVIFAWVFFRAESLAAAKTVFMGMAGLSGVALPQGYYTKLGVFAPLLSQAGITFVSLDKFFLPNFQNSVMWVVVLFLATWFLPNTQQIMAHYRPALDTYAHLVESGQPHWWQWRPAMSWVIILSVLTATSVLGMSRVSEFLYFQF